MVLNSMNMKKRALFASLLLFLTALCFAGNPSQLNKKVQKEVARVFQTEPQFEEAHVPEGVSGIDSLLKEGDQVHVIRGVEGILGYVISTHAKGRYDNFDYSVIFSEDLCVLGVLVTTYRSDHGAGICSKGWLKQFHGYQGEEIKLGKEIDSISGATISASSMVADIKRCYLVMEKLKALEFLSDCHPGSGLRPPVSQS